MDDYKFERFKKIAELCAKEVLGVFEPDIITVQNKLGAV